MRKKSVYWPKAQVAQYLENDVTPKLNPNDILISNHYSLISQSSEREWFKDDTSHIVLGTTFPFIPGYSSAGYVLQVGNNVTQFKPGDKVIGAPVTGAHSNLVMVPEEDVYNVPENVKLDDAVFYNLGMTAIYSLHVANLKFGQSLAIIGYGVVGKIALQAAQASGAHPIIVMDIAAEQRQAALNQGADYALDPNDEDTLNHVLKAIGGGVDIALDVSGSPQDINQSLTLAKPFGTVVWCTATNTPQKIDYGTLFIKCLTIKGDFVNTNMPLQRQSIREFLWLLSSGKLVAPDHSDTIYTPAGETITTLYQHVLHHDPLKNPLFKWRDNTEH
ncbi:zinc-binding alcohol dehydrogenase [Levilactobacillus namurensis]|uniref:zinc-binding alcohol dehydrogenase n=1 Tax=Levilactobacillus namurensis TaxID=380393 RepID=UPI00222F8551|nr:zinc-binding alcohol dehydrogenase [Levilactobacillus namurensis]MCW3778902.1 zinc-binding alcohol dehydrogenase [Levilactobacillus namurensis]MDT7017803.1 zinc-binding alcohol dehydrogenase [Levilactobacillus namurensis]WNN65196.1 zinc-binding alcohol dehydrogenase [Levilactobacillus namurensis]